ncbi:MAG: alpha-L-rhamnosidase N-terminal domain-containing protein, partial [Muribaculaceae bacterium]|nr:alpha-L-rhamnosidase N-terminal domain-containing protein [Muribaculaceae bacterium]
MKSSFIAFLCIACSASLNAEVGNLKVNYLKTPLGVDDTAPRLQWSVTDIAPETVEVIVGTDSVSVANGNGDMWRFNKPGYSTEFVVYKGKTLEPSTSYYWQVIVKDDAGNTAKSDVARFETGLMGNWHGSWISDYNSRDVQDAPYFRKAFDIGKPVKSARLYVATGGLSVVTLNGNRVGDHFLDPVYSRYDRRNHYLTYDVTSMLRRGENVAGVVLGNGWYNHQAKAVWNFDNAPWRNRPAFCMELHIEYA